MHINLNSFNKGTLEKKYGCYHYHIIMDTVEFRHKKS